MRILKYFSIIIIVVALVCFLRSTFLPYQEFGGKIFATTYNIKIRTPLPDKKLPLIVNKRLQTIDKITSVFNPESEISAINQAPAGQKIVLSQELSAILRLAYNINRQSNGAFDPTIAPLVDLWGFGPQHTYQKPDTATLQKTLAYSNFKQLRFSDNFQSITKKHSATKLDLSAIAKGYAVDEIAKLIELKGFKDYIIEIGGEIKTGGIKNEQGDLWNIGIGKPQKNSFSNALVLEISDYALATSGDYRNLVKDENGNYFSHTISPITGKPMQDKLASVTVLHPSCASADAYATAIMALGAEKGMAFARKQNLAVISFTHNDNADFDMISSSAARKLIGWEN